MTPKEEHSGAKLGSYPNIDPTNLLSPKFPTKTGAIPLTNKKHMPLGNTMRKPLNLPLTTTSRRKI